MAVSLGVHTVASAAAATVTTGALVTTPGSVLVVCGTWERLVHSYRSWTLR